MATTSDAANARHLRLVLVGDAGAGKTTLIESMLMGTFVPNVEKCKGVTKLEPDDVDDKHWLDIVDTNSFDNDSSADNAARRLTVEQAVGHCDVVLLLYDVSNPKALENIGGKWVPLFRQWKVTVPIILIGNKTDLLGPQDNNARLETVIMPMLKQYTEIDSLVECSAKELTNVYDVFMHALKAVLYPTGPILDMQTHHLKKPCHDALLRIFKICDADKDGLLNDSELNDFQVTCFGQELPADQLEKMRLLVAQHAPEGVQNNGLNEKGFLVLISIIIEKGRLETVWRALEHFGYAQGRAEIEFAPDYLLPPMYQNIATGSFVELSDDAVLFLKALFQAHAAHSKSERLRISELDGVFDMCSPNGNPWSPAWLKRSVPLENGQVTCEAFLAAWSLMMVQDYEKTLKFLAYLGFDPLTAHPGQIVTPPQRSKRDQRNVLHAVVAGAKGVGKSTLLASMIGAQASAVEGETARFVTRDGDRCLVLRELRSDEPRQVLDNHEHRLMVSCDLLVLMYDARDAHSVEYCERAAAAVLGAPFPVMLVSTFNSADTTHSDANEKARALAKDLFITEPRLIDATAPPAAFFDDAVHVSLKNRDLIKSAQTRKSERRSKVIKTVSLATAAIAVVGALAYLGMRFLSNRSSSSSSSSSSDGNASDDDE